MDDRAHTARTRRPAPFDPHRRLKGLLCECFPAHARIISIPRQADAVFAISWNLLNDPQRPGKRSKTIRLSVSADILDEYGLASEPSRDLVDRRILSVLQRELATFDADHRQRPDEDPLVVLWNVDCD